MTSVTTANKKVKVQEKKDFTQAEKNKIIDKLVKNTGFKYYCYLRI